ncbi:Rap1 Myb domain [Teratosphaeria destructans]|uniref:Telomeric repeat-binding factor 2-interacting protein 1 n=1 Tax=Teratosphaeria destructans TaxID=418781 RepID=A0A9W7VZ25_9PEZI|nr:Rap1 Myb domain [Teratosphaeria destructans]
MAHVVVTGASNATPAMEGVFTGLGFFLVQRLPMRSSYIDKIQANGGRVVKLEAQADHIVADHVRRDCPPGSISYTFIDNALRHGVLPDPEEHAAGPAKGMVRDVGSVIPGKSTRTPFSKEDDRELWLWVECARRAGGQVKGNDIYKQLEARNPRHTFQAWRDRYIKKLIDRPPDGVDVESISAGLDEAERKAYVRPNAAERKRKAEISAHAEAAGFKLPRASQGATLKKRKVKGEENGTGGHAHADSRKGPVANHNVFGTEEFDVLMQTASDIEQLDPEQAETAWQAWADAMKGQLKPHSAEAWRAYWEAEVGPEYRRRKLAKKERRRQARQARRSAASSRAEGRAEGSQKIITTEKASSGRRRQVPADGAAPKDRRNSLTPTPVTASNATNQTSPAQRAIRHAIKTATESQPGLPEKVNSSVFKHDISTQPIEILSDEEDDDQEMQEQKNNLAQLYQPEIDPQTAVAENAVLSDPVRGFDLLTSEADRKAGQQMQQEDREMTGGSDLPTSNDGPALKCQFQRGALAIARQADVPTSELNREASAQLRLGVLDGARESEIPTSDANEAVERQLHQDSLEAEDEDEITPEDAADEYNDEPAEDDIVISTHLVEDGSVEDGLSGEELIDPSVSAQDDTVRQDPVEREDSGDRLTEANLASQQAEHRAQLMRGLDLPPDDENMDQSTYASYLQDLVSQKPATSSREAEMMPKTVQKAPDLTQDDPSKDQSSFAAALQDLVGLKRSNGKKSVVEGASSLPDDKQMPTSADPQVLNDLPLSSQQEIDGLFEGNLHWPASPQQRAPPRAKLQSQRESQSLRFETQVQYPKLREQVEDQDDAEMFTTQPQVSEDVRYPTLPHGDDGEVQTGPFTQNDDLASDRIRSQLDQNVGVDVDEDPADATVNGVKQDLDMDLTLAEPDGGFSSPVKHDASDRQLEDPDGDLDLGLAEPDGGFSSPVKDDHVESGEDDPDELEEGQDSQQPAEQEIVQRSSAEMSSPQPAESQPRSSPPPRRGLGRRALETQDIVDAETQPLDLSMPLPPDTDGEDEGGEEAEEEELHSEPHQVASSPRTTHHAKPAPAQLSPRPSLTPPARQRPSPSKGKQKAPQQPPSDSLPHDDESMDSWIATMHVRYRIPESKEHLIEDALFATSARPDLAEVALLSMLAGKGVPTDLPGVWTAEDDQGCESTDARVVRRCVGKHGEDEFDARMEWLRGWREG